MATLREETRNWVKNKLKYYKDEIGGEQSEMFLEVFGELLEVLERGNELLGELLDEIKEIKEDNRKILGLKHRQLEVEGKLLGEDIVEEKGEERKEEGKFNKEAILEHIDEEEDIVRKGQVVKQ